MKVWGRDSTCSLSYVYRYLSTLRSEVQGLGSRLRRPDIFRKRKYRNLLSCASQDTEFMELADVAKIWVGGGAKGAT